VVEVEEKVVADHQSNGHPLISSPDCGGISATGAL